ncbi:MAG: methylenetetrahydrofolate reductase [NAD(P)H] [Akkermansiaceae bacterium]|nr:methylenetetrahydrofolate reductase [NAD(P)H] [Akkermansiaceae bacterium]NNM30941.1 methylenetetrahydrofolate reductase [NAD(P)H] [Akkermansiaceae bacterium]
MHISEILQQRQPSLSFEFFPPKTPKAAGKLFETIRELERCRPSFVSVTYGAGGSTRELTHQLVLKILEETAIPPVPHFTCVCHGREEIEDILENYARAGVRTILALRGDPPRDRLDYDRAGDAFQFAGELVAFIREFNESGRHPGGGFGIGVAGFPEGHPETQNRVLEMDYLKAKVDAGADYICTQLFFDNHDFLDFRDRCELAGITVPIIAGIMPITTPGGMTRMAELAAGAHFPAKLLKLVTPLENDLPAFAAAGVDYATEQCAELVDHGVAGLHFYTLNKSDATLEIAQRIGLA